MTNVIKDIKENIVQATKALTSSNQSKNSSMKEGVEAVEKAVKKKTSKKKSTKKTEKKVSEEAEAESSKEAVQELEDKKKALLEKAEKLKKEKLEEAPKTEELKEQIKAKKKSDMLIALDEYVKVGIYLGTRVVTPNMKQYVYRRRADGLAIFNTDIIDEKLKEGIEYLSKFNVEDIILVCKREAGWKAAEKFSELTGIRVFTKKYPAGILTNTTLPDFFENELTIITDPWLDKNALNDTLRVHKNVLMICDTNNFSKGADKVIIGNNKSPKSLGLIFYLLARGYLKAKGIDTSQIPDLEWWTGEFDEDKKGASKGV